MRFVKKLTNHLIRKRDSELYKKSADRKLGIKVMLEEITTTTAADPILDRLSKESRQASVQLDQRKTNPHAFDDREGMPVQVSEGLKKVLSELQNKFSGRQQDLANMIEAEVRARTEELYRRAHFDSLTHLPNRAHFQDLLEQMVQSSNENDLDFTLLFLDLDGFKKVNDSFGHHIGDELLRHVSARLVSSVREEDIVGRLGGDEFVILLTNASDNRSTVEGICHRVISEVSRPYFFESKEVSISTSIGIGLFPQDGHTAAELIKHADEALYVAKNQGKRNYRFYMDVKDAVPAEQYKVLAEFEQAIEEGKLYTRVQPQVDLKQNHIVGGCLNVHWDNDHFDGSEMNQWCELLKKTHWQQSVALWVLDTAGYYAAEWQRKSSEFVVTVPVLEILWQSDNLLEILAQRLQRFQIEARQLQLAFSLRSLTELDAFFVNRLKALSEAGYQITLTDLGAEPLDLNLLVDLQVQEFRFDQTWLKKQMASKPGRQWVQAMIQMVRSLDASMIATGIETETEYQQLKDWGCVYGQGDFWSEEIATNRFAKLIA